MKMKKILAGVCLAWAATVSFANPNQINFVKKVYADALNDNFHSKAPNSPLFHDNNDVINLYAAPDLKQFISKVDKIAIREDNPFCAGEYDKLWQGQDYDFKPNQLQYSPLSNGRIRVQGKNFGEKFTVDFDVKCDAKSCTIADIFDPHSYKQHLAAIVKKRTCH